MSSTKLNKRVVIIAGPNGAGKMTFAREFLPTDADCPNFVKADLIAAFGIKRIKRVSIAIVFIKM